MLIGRSDFIAWISPLSGAVTGLQSVPYKVYFCWPFADVDSLHVSIGEAGNETTSSGRGRAVADYERGSQLQSEYNLFTFLRFEG